MASLSIDEDNMASERKDRQSGRGTRAFRRLIAGVLLMAGVAQTPPAWAQDPAGQVRVISTELFLQPRSGERLVQLPVLREAALDWIEGRSRRLTIRYPGGEEGTFWARELRDWLVALGVASSNIELLPGASEADALVIEPW